MSGCKIWIFSEFQYSVHSWSKEKMKKLLLSTHFIHTFGTSFPKSKVFAVQTTKKTQIYTTFFKLISEFLYYFSRSIVDLFGCRFVRYFFSAICLLFNRLAYVTKTRQKKSRNNKIIASKKPNSIWNSASKDTNYTLNWFAIVRKLCTTQ